MSENPLYVEIVAAKRALRLGEDARARYEQAIETLYDYEMQHDGSEYAERRYQERVAEKH